MPVKPAIMERSFLSIFCRQLYGITNTTNRPIRPNEKVLSGLMSGSTGTKRRRMAHRDGMALTIENGTMYRIASATMPNQKFDVILLTTGTRCFSIHA